MSSFFLNLDDVVEAPLTFNLYFSFANLQVPVVGCDECFFFTPKMVNFLKMSNFCARPPANSLIRGTRNGKSGSHGLRETQLRFLLYTDGRGYSLGSKTLVDSAYRTLSKPLTLLDMIFLGAFEENLFFEVL